MSVLENMMICPYDRSHIVSKLRMPMHLVRCEANHPNVFLATCYYEFCHRVPPEEFDDHLKNCPKKTHFALKFAVNEEPSDKVEDNANKIFLTHNTPKPEEKEHSGKRSGRKAIQDPVHQIQSIFATNKDGITKTEWNTTATSPDSPDSTTSTSTERTTNDTPVGRRPNKPKRGGEGDSAKNSRRGGNKEPNYKTHTKNAANEDGFTKSELKTTPTPPERTANATPVGRSKKIISVFSKKEKENSNTDSPSLSKGTDGHRKPKGAEAKEGLKVSDSSEKTNQRASASSTTTGKDDKGSSQKNANTRVKVDEDGFVQVSSKKKNKRRNRK